MTGDLREDSLREHVVYLSCAASPAHDAQIREALNLPPDLTAHVEHGGCGEPGCTRPDGPVQISITWLTGGPMLYKIFLHDEGHPACAQTVQRAQALAENLLALRSRS